MGKVIKEPPTCPNCGEINTRVDYWGNPIWPCIFCGYDPNEKKGKKGK